MCWTASAPEGMGVIYLAEHIRMRRRVAIKTLTFTEDQDERLRLRFDAEMRAVAQLRHQNIVTPIDFGEEHSPNPDIGSLHYFVMEYLPGEDLEALIHGKGPLTPDRACRLAHQVADALNEAHSHQLIHRDIKPSNILVTPEGSAKLLDFGLARSARARLTEPGSVLGTLGYMAPEQARDATTVDERADIYSLGATLFWALTGQDPFPLTSNVAQDLNLRLTQPPPSARSIQPEVPARLDDIVAKMMAIDPADRYSTAEAVMQALLPLTVRATMWSRIPRPAAAAVNRTGARPMPPRAQRRILVVDDEAGIRTFCSLALRRDAVECEEAADGLKALEALKSRPFDLVLLDIDMPNLNGTETLRHIRMALPAPNLKVVMFSGRSTADDMAQLLSPAGADDFLPKPFTIVQLRARVNAALRLKDAPRPVGPPQSAPVDGQRGSGAEPVGQRRGIVRCSERLVLAIARLVEARGNDSGSHLLRLRQFSRTLGDEALAGNDFGPVVDAAFVQMLEACASAARYRQGGPSRPYSEQAGQTRSGRTPSDADAHRCRRGNTSRRGQIAGIHRRLLANGRGHRRSHHERMTAPAIPTGWRAKRSRCRPGSWPWPTFTTLSVPAESTSLRCRTRSQWRP